MSTRYEFVTRWEIDAPLPAVWDQIAHPLRWPEWWPGVQRVVELEPGGDDGVGSLLRYTWRSRLPYRLTFDLRATRAVHHALLEGRATGELEGFGRWTFEPHGRRTRVRYDWQVETTKRWMQILAPVARPLFAWNHDVVMGWGLDGLRRRLRAGGIEREASGMTREFAPPRSGR